MTASHPSTKERTCEHGSPLRSYPNWSGGWNGPVSECSCCFSVFGYIDEGSLSVLADGRTVCHGKSWTPKDLCRTCGGKYVEF